MTEVRLSPSIGTSEAKMQPAQAVVGPGPEIEKGGEDEQDEASQQSWATQATSLISQDLPTEAERDDLADPPHLPTLRRQHEIILCGVYWMKAAMVLPKLRLSEQSSKKWPYPKPTLAEIQAVKAALDQRSRVADWLSSSSRNVDSQGDIKMMSKPLEEDGRDRHGMEGDADRPPSAQPPKGLATRNRLDVSSL
jgi:hypothetical protein